MTFLNKMILEEIELGEYEESKKRTILDNLGKQVILYDSYNYWVHGLLLKGGYSDYHYQIQIADGRGQSHLRYNKLEKLFLLKAHKNNPLPEIKIE